MANMLAGAMSFLGTAMNESMSELVTISSGKFMTENVKATVGRTRKEQVADGGGSTVETSVTDFLIDKSAYMLNGEVVEPSQNHVITRTTGQKYKPTPMIPQEPVWRWMSDANPIKRRIHAVEVAN